MNRQFAASCVPVLAGAVAVVIGLGLGGTLERAGAAEAKPPQAGAEAPDFELANLDGDPVTLASLRKQGPVVLIVLRGYPGYQCPICTRQVGAFLGAAEKLREQGATVAMVYPGPAEGLSGHAEQFISGKTLPENFHFLVDPDYEFTRAYHLRWDALRETAYPATFVIDRDGRVAFAKVSRTHGDRASVEQVLQALEKLRADRPSNPDQTSSGAFLAPAVVLRRVRRHRFHPVEDGFTQDAALGHHGIADLANDDWRVRTLAVRDLARNDAPAVPTLLEGLKDDDLHVRHICALTLGILPTDQEFTETLPARRRALQQRLKTDSSSIVRSEAAIALGRIGGEASVAALEKVSEEDASRDVRHQCVLALNRIAKNDRDRSVFEAYRSLDESRFDRVEVGQPAVDFTLRDTEGRPWSLSDYLGKKPVVLIWIFADWCPVCHGEFRDLIGMKEEFLKSDVEVVTIQCHDTYRTRMVVGKEALPQYWFAEQAPQEAYRQGLSWPHLADPAGAVGAVYGAQPLAFAVHSEYINRPSTIIIDADGIVRFAYDGTYWGDRPSIEQTLEMVRRGEFEFEHPERLQMSPAD